MKKISLFHALLISSSLTISAQCPDENHPHMIDLGLASGTLWSCCNVGASCPEGYGGYYAWGETVEKETYRTDNYPYWVYHETVPNIGNNHDIKGTEYDVAYVKLGTNWVIPSKSEMEELFELPTSSTTINDTKCIVFNGNNGKKLYFPMGGYKRGTSLNDVDGDTYFWTSNQKCKDGGIWDDDVYAGNIDHFEDGGSAEIRNTAPYWGCLVRPVANGETGIHSIREEKKPYTMCIESGSIIIDFSNVKDGASWAIYAIDGICRQKSKTTCDNVQISGIHEGVYFVELIMNGQRWVEKIIIN